MNNNSSRSGLFLMELIVSILFFSLAGAICVKLFVGSHLLSQKSVELNHSLEWCQNTAEIFYGCQGDETAMNEILQGDLSSGEKESTITVYLDQDFQPVSQADASSYVLYASITKSSPLLSCSVSVRKGDAAFSASSSIYDLTVTLFSQKENHYE